MDRVYGETLSTLSPLLYATLVAVEALDCQKVLLVGCEASSPLQVDPWRGFADWLFQGRVRACSGPLAALLGEPDHAWLESGSSAEGVPS